MVVSASVAQHGTSTTVLGRPIICAMHRSHATSELANLDFLRAMAVGLVFVGHLLGTMRIRGAGNLGHFGVLLFFVHTAFVLMMSMERLGLSGRNLYSVFIVRRFYRIYPLSVLSVFVVTAFQVPSTSWLGGYEWAGWPTLVSNLFLTQNLTQSSSVNCVLWSLPFEIQMYAILPFLFSWASRVNSCRSMLAAFLLAVSVATTEYMVRFGDSGPDFLVTRYCPCFLAGVIGWRLAKARRRRLPGWGWVLFLVALVGIYRLGDLVRVYGPDVLSALHGALKNDHRRWWPPYLDLVNDWAFCVAVGLAVPLFLDIRCSFLNWISKQLARYSYGLYVSHVPLLWLCFVWWRPRSAVLSLALAILLTAIVSILVYHSLEDPAIRVGKRAAARILRRGALA